jgi:hypothetical protein
MYLQLYTQDGLARLPLGHATLYSVALAFLAEVDTQRKTSNEYAQEFHKGFAALQLGKKQVNFVKLLENFVATCDGMWGKEFATQTFRGKFRLDRTAEEYDPNYDLHRTYEARKTLGEANTALLVKALRLFVIELCNRVFGKKSDPAEWDSSAATYRSGSTRCSCIDFVDFVDELLSLYDCVTRFSDDLREVRTLLEKCVTAQRASRIEAVKGKPVTQAVRQKPVEVRPTKIRVNNLLAAGPPPAHAWKNGNPIVAKKPKADVEEPVVALAAPTPAPTPALIPAPAPALPVLGEESDEESGSSAPAQEDDGWTEVKPQTIVVQTRGRNGQTRTIRARLNKQTGTYVA